MLVDLGLQDHIVGRSRFCSFLDKDIPAIGDLLSIDLETLVRVDPTHVLVQPPAAGVDPALRDLCDRQGWKLATWEIDSIDQIEQVVRELPDVLYENGSAEHRAVVARSTALLNELAQSLSPQGQPVFNGRTLIVHQVDPVGISGRHTYLHELLARLGGTNAATADGWLELTLEDVARMNPEAILLVRPGHPADADVSETAGPLATLDIIAAREDRIAVLSDPDALLPCTSIARVAGELRAVLVRWAEREP